MRLTAGTRLAVRPFERLRAVPRRQYDVVPDGRFLINTVLDSVTAPITLIQNWQPDAKK